MDVATSDVPTNVESVEMNSVVEEIRDVNEESAAPPLKKPRFDEEVNRVAEIVLVLSALGRIRGGKTPTDLELELMVKAKSILAEMCQEFASNVIIGRDAIGTVIEDLDLNGKLKDQRLGFRAPKLTISEKLSLGKRKMEETKKTVSTSYTAPRHSTSANNVSMAHQWPKTAMKASTSSVNATGSHFVMDASGIRQSRLERPQFKSDMHTSASQGPVPARNYFGNATTCTSQPHSTSSTISFGTASDSKVHAQSSSRVTDPSFRPFMSQTPPGTFPGMKGVSYGQASNSNHAGIAKIIHKGVQPRDNQNLLWNPPSREYMSKVIKCQMCQGTINEVGTVLICDACEKGYHLRCLHVNNLKRVPKSEWHCSRCVQLYKGKSFPPKYGRVMRSSTTAKMSFSTREIQSPVEKKVGEVNEEPMSHSETAGATQDEVAMSQTIEADDDVAISRAKYESQEPVSHSETALEVAMSLIIEAEDAAISRAVEANYESQGLGGNDSLCDDDPSEKVSHEESLNPPKLEKGEDPNKAVTEIFVS